MPTSRDHKPQISLPGLLAFDSVARHMNFARAAAELAVTPTAMSKIVKNLEAQLGVRLFNRTTRSVGLTEHGAQLLETLAPALELIRRSVEQVATSAGRPKGVLRINTSYVAFASLIEPYQADFVKRFPDVTLEVAIDHALADIVAGGFDAGIRLGHAVQRDMIGVPMGPAQRLVVVGSPKYLAARGVPEAPKDLLEHECIRQRLGSPGRFFEWRFKSGPKSLAIDVQGRLVYSEMRCALAAARQGLGLAYVFRHFAEPALRAREVMPVLEKHCPAAERFYLYYPNRSQTPGKLRAFIEFVQAMNWNPPGHRVPRKPG